VKSIPLSFGFKLLCFFPQKQIFRSKNCISLDVMFLYQYHPERPRNAELERTHRMGLRFRGTSWFHNEPQIDGPSLSLGLIAFPGGTKPLHLLTSPEKTLAPGTGQMLTTCMKPRSILAWLSSPQIKELTLLQGQEQTRVPQLTAFTTKRLSRVEISFKRQGKACLFTCPIASRWGKQSLLGCKHQTDYKISLS